MFSVTATYQIKRVIVPKLLPKPHQVSKLLTTNLSLCNFYIILIQVYLDLNPPFVLHFVTCSALHLAMAVSLAYSLPLWQLYSQNSLELAMPIDLESAKLETVLWPEMQQG